MEFGVTAVSLNYCELTKRKPGSVIETIERTARA
jgi:hypothetical protein